MAISKEIQYTGIDDLLIDPFNPRLGKNITSQKLSQEKLLELMKELIKLNTQVATGTTLKNPGQVKNVKKNIARLRTILKTK